MKNFFLAVLIGILLMTSLGSLAHEWWGVQLVLDSDFFSPAENLLVLAGVAVLLVMVGFIVAVSIFGAIALALFAAFVAMLSVGLSLFWPILLVVGVVWLVGRSRRTDRQAFHV